MYINNNKTNNSTYFGAINKNSLTNTQRFYREMFKPKLEKFNDISELEQQSIDKFEEIINKDRLPGINDQIKDWINCLSNIDNNIPDGNFWKSIIMNSMDKIKEYVPLCDPKVLNETISELSKLSNRNVKFEKYYANNLRKSKLHKYKMDENYSGWITVDHPNNEIEFKEKVNDLRGLSMNTLWCTKSKLFAEMTLEQGRMHILYKDGKPQLGIRTVPKESFGSLLPLRNKEITAEIKNKLNETKYDTYCEEIKKFLDKNEISAFDNNMDLFMG